MKLIYAKKVFSLINIGILTVVLGGQIVRAEETTLNQNELNNDKNTAKQLVSETHPASEIKNSNNFQKQSSASDLKLESRNSQTRETAQNGFEVEPGTETRSGSSYIGVGGNIGFTGDTTLGRGAFAVISKIGLTDYLSFRPSAIINDNAVFLLPVTIDFSQDEVPNAEFSIAPYLGGGLAISTGRDDTIGPLISGGLDIPLSTEFTANAEVDVSFINETDVGLILGVGYNF